MIIGWKDAVQVFELPKTIAKARGRRFKTVLRLMLLSLFVAQLLLTSAACRRGAEPGTLVIALETTPRGFDPRFSTNVAQSARIMQIVYDTLVVKDEKFEFVPALAERFEESEDHKTFTFHLRPGVRFHTGKPLSSADVKYTFDSLLAPALRSPIRGAVDKITSIETPDPLTVIFRAQEPFYTFISNLAAIGIIPEGAGTEIINAPVGTGPYKMTYYKEGESVRLEANPDYWGGPPNIPRVNIKIVTDNSTRQAELMSGEVDVVYNAQFDPETVRALQGRSGIQIVNKEGVNIDYLGLNLTQGSELRNQKLRRAVAYALDRDVIIHRLLRDQARQADAILPPEHWAYENNVTVYGHEPDRAKQLLDEAGYPDPDGDGPQPRLALSLMTTTTQISRNIAAIMQDQLRRVGIHLELNSLELATLFDRIGKAQYDIYYLRSIGANQSTDVFQFVYHSRYQDPEFNESIARLRAASTAAEMRPLFEVIESRLAKREYCPNSQVEELAEQAARLGATESATARKKLYLQISNLLTDRGGQNRMRYCDPQLDAWIIEAEQANDRAMELGLYSRIQKTVSEQLPQIYLWYPANVLVARARVANIQIDPSGSWYFITKLTLEDDR